MLTNSLSLGEHWEIYISNEIASGRYGSASNVVRDALHVIWPRALNRPALVSTLIISQ
ncbi:type II toxin-antitoxin system ParD family antitoxin [Spiribacter sp. 2438]|uniref:type II toxin-antitoxin system ParD family antitoxin n=1 Tax=Spiribacter sp. 2438 TaxID=2666185 RepID=UPI001E5B482F|nr:type II toxin-antitoxin system ParD family antitoxin [Spiribacter sp. 2438]